MYTVVNEKYPYGRYDNLPDRGLSFNGRCRRRCSFYMTISPTDMRYNEAQITGVLNLPECFNSSNVTDPMTLNIQGTLYTGIYYKIFHALYSIECIVNYSSQRRRQNFGVEGASTYYVEYTWIS